MNYRRRYNLDQLVKEYEARIATEKADSVTDDVKDEKKEEKATAPAAQSNTNESTSTEEQTPESQQTPTEAGKTAKPDTNSSITTKKDVVMEVGLFECFCRAFYVEKSFLVCLWSVVWS